MTAGTGCCLYVVTTVLRTRYTLLRSPQDCTLHTFSSVWQRERTGQITFPHVGSDKEADYQFDTIGWLQRLPSVVLARRPAACWLVVLPNSLGFQGDPPCLSTLYHSEPLCIFIYLASPHRLCTSYAFWNILPKLLSCLCRSIFWNLGMLSWFSLPKEQDKNLTTWNSRFHQINDVYDWV